MKLYRSINEKEFRKLIREIKVRGMYDCAFESQCEANYNNVICTFTQEFRWKDKEHIFYLVLEIPTNRIIGIKEAKYWVSKETIRNKVWTGRKGQEIFVIEEAYLDEYGIEDVISIKGINMYAPWYVEKYIKPIAEKYRIKLEK